MSVLGGAAGKRVGGAVSVPGGEGPLVFLWFREWNLSCN